MAGPSYSQAFFYIRDTGRCIQKSKSYIANNPTISKNYTSIQEFERTSWEDIVKNPKNGFKKLQEGIYGAQGASPNNTIIVLLGKTLEDFERFCKKNNLPFRPENVLQKNSNVKEAFKQFVEKLRKIEGYEQRVGTIGSEGFDLKAPNNRVLPVEFKEDGLFHFKSDPEVLAEKLKFSYLDEIMLDNHTIRPEDLLKWIERFIDKTEVWVKKNQFCQVIRHIDGNRNKRIYGIVNPKNNRVAYMIMTGREEGGYYYADFEKANPNINSKDIEGKIEDRDDYSQLHKIEFLENVVKPKLLKYAEKSSGDKGKDFFENIIVKVFNVCNVPSIK